MSNPVSFTETAARRVREIMNGKDDVVGIRVAVEPKGCMGLSYILGFEYTSELDPTIDNVIIEDKDIKVYIDKRAYEFLNGTIIDFIDDGFGSQFVFNNPNAKNKCGCGNSFCV